jgi:hypothetical protein
MRRLLVRLVALMCVGMSISFAVIALMRPHADNQRNLLVLAAVAAALAAASLVAATTLSGGARELASRIRREWSDGGA